MNPQPVTLPALAWWVGGLITGIVKGVTVLFGCGLTGLDDVW